MTVQQTGRRERKKAATRQKIADTALRLFLERGYDAVGIRDVAAEADVAVTTLFSHFPASEEALVFEQDEDFEHRLTRAVTDRAPHEPLIPALRREVLALGPALHRGQRRPGLAHDRRVSRPAEVRRVGPPAPRGGPGHGHRRRPRPDPESNRRPHPREVRDRRLQPSREAADPEAALDEIFPMIEAAWEAAPRD
ncbi:TetR/AcrR family transcriptional regulator [Streptomyces violaceorubidus]